MGDFLGFTFGNVKSSDLGIYRVSDGDRYKDTLHPEIKDRTAEVVGLDGEYYFGSDFGTRSFDIDIAYDSLKESQLKTLRKVFGTKGIRQLIFDECPYKRYMVKIEDPIELSYICFDEPKKIAGEMRDGVRRTTRIENEPVIDEETGEPVIDEETGQPVTQPVRYRDIEQVEPYEVLDETERIYKGEGNITFVAYFPFAKSTFKVLPGPNDKYYEGSKDWAISSGILSAEERSAKSIDTYQNGAINVYNGGDIATGFRLYCPAAASAIQIHYNAGASNDSVISSLILDKITLKSGDVGFIVDTNTGLIVGVSEFSTDVNNNAIYKTSGNLYNEYVNSGYFFKLQPNIASDNAQITITGVEDTPQIFYDYLYF